MKTKNIITYTIASLLILTGIILAIQFHNKYFCGILFTGILILFWNIYNKVSKKPLFYKFKPKHHILFWADIIFASIIIDYIGTKLNYWQGAFDGIKLLLKYSFEWAIPLVSTTIIFMTFKQILENKKLNKHLASIISLAVFITTLGIITTLLNSFGQAWTVNLNKTLFSTVGFWIMALIPYVKYKLIQKYVVK